MHVPKNTSPTEDVYNVLDHDISSDSDFTPTLLDLFLIVKQ